MLTLFTFKLEGWKNEKITLTNNPYSLTLRHEFREGCQKIL